MKFTEFLNEAKKGKRVKKLPFEPKALTRIEYKSNHKFNDVKTSRKIKKCKDDILSKFDLEFGDLYFDSLEFGTNQTTECDFTITHRDNSDLSGTFAGTLVYDADWRWEHIENPDTGRSMDSWIEVEVEAKDFKVSPKNGKEYTIDTSLLFSKDGSFKDKSLERAFYTLAQALLENAAEIASEDAAEDANDVGYDPDDYHDRHDY